MNSLVSIIVPCYNSESFIAETLDSVLKQTYNDWECIIVDDGSTDNSAVVAREYADRNSRFTYIHKRNEGTAIARNSAIRASKGRYILPLDADDIIAPQYVEDAVRVLDEHPEVKVVYCNAEKFGRKKGAWNLPDFDFKLLLSMNLIFCTAMYRREDYDKTVGYNPNMPGMEDWDFWLSLIKKDDVVVRLDPVYFFYRTHKMSRNRMAVKKIEDIHRQLYLNHKELYADYIDNPIQVLKEWKKYKAKRFGWF